MEEKSKDLYTSGNKQKLFEDQKKLLDTFLKTGAIDKVQYDKSINGLKRNMEIKG